MGELKLQGPAPGLLYSDIFLILPGGQHVAVRLGDDMKFQIVHPENVDWKSVALACDPCQADLKKAIDKVRASINQQLTGTKKP